MNKDLIKEYQQLTVREIGIKWDPRRLLQPRLPAVFGAVANKTPFDTPVTLQTKMTKMDMPESLVIAATDNQESFVTKGGLYIEDLPVKFPQTEYRIPRLVWDNFGDVLSRIMVLEGKINSTNIDNQYAYLTIHQGVVEPNKTQRPPGVHLDGFQKHSIIPQIAQHQISVCNTLPTIFYAAAMDAESISLPKGDLFRSMNKQCQDMPTFSAQPYDLHLLNAFCPHRPAEASEPVFRTFIRFSVSSIPFMVEKNTHNPLFDYKWDDAAKAKFYRSITKPEFLNGL